MSDVKKEITNVENEITVVKNELESAEKELKEITKSKESKGKKEVKEEKMINISMSLPEEDYNLIMILFNKIKKENPKMSDEEIHGRVYLNVLSYTLL